MNLLLIKQETSYTATQIAYLYFSFFFFFRYTSAINRAGEKYFWFDTHTTPRVFSTVHLQFLFDSAIITAES